jgi:hypothetical protein
MTRLGKLLRGLFGVSDPAPEGAAEPRADRRRAALTLDDDRAGGADERTGARRGRGEVDAAREPDRHGAPTDEDDPQTIPDVVQVPIEDALDLHTFPPNETRHVVEAYIEEAVFQGLREVRIIHGRGKGMQRQTVRTILEQHPLVVDFFDADPGRGGWGATIARLRPLGEMEGGRSAGAATARTSDA